MYVWGNALAAPQTPYVQYTPVICMARYSGDSEMHMLQEMWAPATRNYRQFCTSFPHGCTAETFTRAESDTNVKQTLINVLV